MNNRKKQLTLGILAHVDAGKTTLAESILYITGVIRKLGRVDHKNAFLDTFEMERSRGITIFSKQARFDLEDTAVTLLDTPGHVDFSAEMERTLQVLDYAVLVISGPDGIQGHDLTLWRLLKQYQIPVFIFVNKMDQPGVQAEQVMKNIGAILTEAGTDYTKVVKTTCFLADMADFAAFNAVYEKYFTEKPARSCVAVKQLPKNVLCEVEVTAYLK